MRGCVLSELNTTPMGSDEFPSKADVAAAQAWMASYRFNSPHTRRAYEKEINRFVLWCKISRKRFPSLTVEDVADFLCFLSTPPEALQGASPVRRDHNWRPFCKRLSVRSVRYSLVVIKRCMNFLVQTGYLQRNVFSLMSKDALVAIASNRSENLDGRNQLVRYSDVERSRYSREIERVLDVEDWALVLRFISQLPTSSDAALRRKIQVEWVMRLLYFTGLRRSEATSARMKDIRVQGRYWVLTVIGKGGRPRDIQLPGKLVGALKTYRAHLGLPERPDPAENTPLILSCHLNKGISDGALYKLVTQVFKQVSLLCEGEQALRFSYASTHWLRHTNASHSLAAGASLKTVQTQLAHRNVNTTMIYIHKDKSSIQDEIDKF